MADDIIQKIKDSGLLGRGGAGFLAGLKWEVVKNSPTNERGKKYIVCNASEGEPDVFKDKFILENHLSEIINGIKIALDTFENSFAYIYLNKNYYKKLNRKIRKAIGNLPIALFEKPKGYIAGEETSVLEVIEGKRSEPRIKPPFPIQSGLWGCPTLINNVETFYHISKILKGEYKNTCFYCVSGKAKNPGVFELPETSTIEEILKETRNTPDFNFFLQVGGGASGEIILPDELNQKIKGLGSIIIFDKNKTDFFVLMKKWAEFFIQGNCDKCVPCREGVYRINEMLKTGQINKETLQDIFFVLEKTSFCALGRGAMSPFKTLITKLL